MAECRLKIIQHNSTNILVHKKKRRKKRKKGKKAGLRDRETLKHTKLLIVTVLTKWFISNMFQSLFLMQIFRFPILKLFIMFELNTVRYIFTAVFE